MSLVEQIDALLPQTQCTECGFNGCLPYAQALAKGSAPIDRCPPGGVETVLALGALLHQDATPFLEKVAHAERKPALAFIHESQCIGCTKCIQACPVDAIIGSAKRMHSILTTECTGCGLCIEPCPVDCIEMQPVQSATYDKALARARFNARAIRSLREKQEKEKIYQEKRRIAAQSRNQQQEKAAKQDYILQALARVQSKKKS